MKISAYAQNDKYWIPSYTDVREIPVYIKNGPKQNRLERKGAIVKYYCEYECYQEHL